MHILPALTNNSLLRVRTFADNGYVTIFHKGNKGAMVHDNNDVNITSTKPAILQGCQDANGLWHIQLTKASGILCNPTVHHINNIYDLQSTKHTICYLHAALSFLTETTLLLGICHDNLTTFLRLMTTNVAMHFPESDETQKRHMEQIKQGIFSTKPKQENHHSIARPGIKHSDVYLHVHDATKTTMYTNQTGCFPVISRWGNKYIMVAIKLDDNYIDAKCLKSHKTNQTFTNAG
ncbi:hypothetical protein ACHAW6_002116 [Cyclotella cf. meneghiniana]